METFSKIFIILYALLKGLFSGVVTKLLAPFSGGFIAVWITNFTEIPHIPLEILLIPPLAVGIFYILRICRNLYLIHKL